MRKTKGEDLTKRLFKELFKVDCEDIPREKDKKTADYFLKADNRIIAVCEVEDIEYDYPSEERGWKLEPDGGWSKEAPVNDEGRIGKKVQRAFSQLKDYSCPKILVIVDFDDFAHPLHSLEAATTGVGGSRIIIQETFGGVEINANSYHIAKGKIKDMVEKIDLYFWIDGQKKKFIGSRCFSNNFCAKQLQKFIWTRKIV